MLRTLRVHWPSVRMTAGSSLGPITISATMPIRRNSLQLMSNMRESSRPVLAASDIRPDLTVREEDRKAAAAERPSRSAMLASPRVRSRADRAALGHRALDLAVGL